VQALEIPIFSLDVRPERSRVVLFLTGELDCATAPCLESALDELLAAGWDDVVLDVAQVAFVDATGLVAMLAAHRRAQEDGWRFVIAGRCPALDRLLEVTGLTGVVVRA
jgi:anti-sigma B factor antagonist